ncbi:sec1 family domain-containing protein 2-like [Plakobranchus ocellatus]|uniref:Sec1 family domain-containing protein 2-like n=1 Tax=Plakobranchus ocellatus TaxID=259542 RepID=A0AAV4CAA0_9GAST|nr:sec1 family domain-containing protein 2-like [Plakobranchus ocellatus]
MNRLSMLLSSLLEPGDDMTPASAQPLLSQMMAAILDPARPDLPDVECKSGGLGTLLKSGFGFFWAAPASQA